jgi:hypothetical protein
VGKKMNIVFQGPGWEKNEHFLTRSSVGKKMKIFFQGPVWAKK